MNGLGTARVAVIDDEPEEAMPILKALSCLGISAAYFDGTHDQIPRDGLAALRLAILDLRLYGSTSNDSSHFVGQALNFLRRLMPHGANSFGVLVWAKYDEDFQTLTTMLKLPDYADLNPVFLLRIKNKSQILSNEATAPKQIEKAISENFDRLGGCNILWSWEEQVSLAASETTGLLFEMAPLAAPSIQDGNSQLIHLLCAIAGAAKEGGQSVGRDTLVSWLYQSLNPLHYDRLENRTIAAPKPAFPLPKTVSINTAVKAVLNSRLILARDTDQSNQVKPGNIYIRSAKWAKKCPFRKLGLGTQHFIKQFLDLAGEETIKALNKAIDRMVKNGKNSTQENIESLRKKRKELENAKKAIYSSCKSVLIEISPSCDYAQGKRPVARFIAGLLVPEALSKRIKKCGYFMRLEHSLCIDDSNSEWILVLDLRYQFGMQNPEKEILARAAFRLREDVLNRIRSQGAEYSSRPGHLYI